jgi:hypothetical protein
MKYVFREIVRLKRIKCNNITIAKKVYIIAKDGKKITQKRQKKDIIS